MKRILGLAIAAIAILALGQAGLYARLGAHPFWADFTAPALGLIVGALGYAVALWRYRTGLVLAALVLAGAVAAAHFGKQVFVASFADNALAGDFWFFGWIAVCGASVTLTAAVLDRWLFRAART